MSNLLKFKRKFECRPLIENHPARRLRAALGVCLEAPGRDRRDPPGGGSREVSMPLALRPVHLFGKEA